MLRTLVVSLTNRGITFLLGGVRSGKSRLAQKMAARYEHVLVIATAREVDEEMCAKIARHRADRPPRWETVEEPLDLGRVVRSSCASYDALLIDCLTLWASHLLLEPESSRLEKAEDFYQQLETLHCPAVIVSNEVGSGIVPAYASARLFRDVLGEINQRVAALADNVALMVAGLPLVIKGEVKG